jgi:glycine betaine/choline ABC-type transport system substrate-binding protein
MGGAQVLAALIIAVVLPGCSDDRRSLTVGSKNFMEQVLLGEIVAQHLEQRFRKPVERKLNLGGTLLAHQALVKGEIDLYPEYTGTAISSVLHLPSSSDPAELLARVRREYQSRFNLHWLDPLGFDNTFAMVIRRADAEEHRLASLSDAAHYSPGWTLGVGYEFQQRPDGLPKLLDTYPLTLIGRPKVMDLGLLYRALQQKQVSMIAANSTDGLLSELDVTVLRDDRKCFPPYQAAFVVRRDALQRELSLEHALQELSGKFTEETMRRLNHRVIVQHGSVQDVARQFLKDSGLLR